MRLVVTGAAGLTGGALVRELLRRGHEVVGVTRRRSSVARIPGGAAVAVADCADPRALAPLLERAEGLVHVAGILLGSAVAEAGPAALRRVVAVSTAGIYSRYRSSADLYRRNEATLRAAHPSALFVRPTMIYGSVRDRNIHRVIAFAKRWGFLPLPSGGRSFLQPIHYADLAAAIAALVEGDASGAVDAGGPAPITIRQAATAIFLVLGRPAVLVPFPVAMALPLASAVDRVTGSRGGERLRRLREDRTVDNGRLLALTGVRLRSFEEGVRDEVAELAGSRA